MAFVFGLKLYRPLDWSTPCLKWSHHSSKNHLYNQVGAHGSFSIDLPWESVHLLHNFMVFPNPQNTSWDITRGWCISQLGLSMLWGMSEALNYYKAHHNSGSVWHDYNMEWHNNNGQLREERDKSGCRCTTLLTCTSQPRTDSALGFSFLMSWKLEHVATFTVGGNLLSLRPLETLNAKQLITFSSKARWSLVSVFLPNKPWLNGMRGWVHSFGRIEEFMTLALKSGLWLIKNITR